MTNELIQPQIPSTKIVIVLNTNLAPWQCANVTAGLMGGIASKEVLLVHEPYTDASGREYLPLLSQPAFIFEATALELKRTYDRAVSRNVIFGIYLEEIFAAGYANEHRTVIHALDPGSMKLAGLAFYADAKLADKITSGLDRHR